VLVLTGYLLSRWGKWPAAFSAALSKFVFAVALPALLFRLMAGLGRAPAVDTRLLIAFFGGCLLVFVIGRLVGRYMFRLDGVEQSVFALGGIFANNVLLGLPIAKVALGEAAIPAVALVLVFNSLLLWTLATVSVEWARNGALSVRGFGQALKSVLTNPLIVGILAGAPIGLLNVPLPLLLDEPLRLVGESAAPLALIVLGMGLREYGMRQGLREGAAIMVIKLLVQPLVVWALALLLQLPRLETQVVVLLASMSVGINVYLMAREFRALEGAVATSMVLSTILAAVTTPLVLTLLT